MKILGKEVDHLRSREEQWGVKPLREHPEWRERAAEWFAGKWGIAVEEYAGSMEEGERRPDGVPQWYVVTDGGDEIIAGAGLIENDFHDRKDLSPNVCALYVEEAYRGRGIAGRLLETVLRDAGRMGYPQLYLVTEHTTFYERYGWQFLTTVLGDDGIPMRLYEKRTEVG